jgi:tetratricopeptide (TPR) repeat protein
MMFHYHRGWTLNLLGRYEEAVAEFTEGLKTQPDYQGAFDRRACAYARLGRLPEALADRQRADAEMDSIWSDARRMPSAEHDRAWAEGVVKALEAAIARGSNEPMSVPCEGSWDYGEKRRERSSFLPMPKAATEPR